MTDTLKKWASAIGAILFIIVPGSSFIVAGWIWLKHKAAGTKPE